MNKLGRFLFLGALGLTGLGCAPYRFPGVRYEIPRTGGTIAFDISHEVRWILGYRNRFSIDLDGAEVAASSRHPYEHVIGSGLDAVGRVVVPVRADEGPHDVRIVYRYGLGLVSIALYRVPAYANRTTVIEGAFTHVDPWRLVRAYTVDTRNGQEADIRVQWRVTQIRQ